MRARSFLATWPSSRVSQERGLRQELDMHQWWFLEKSPRNAGSGREEELIASSLLVGGVPGLDAGLAACVVVCRRCSAGAWSP